MGYDWVLLGFYYKGRCAVYISMLLGKFYGMLLSFHAHTLIADVLASGKFAIFCASAGIYVILYCIECIFVSYRYLTIVLYYCVPGS